MKYIKNFLSMVICFVMITGITFAQTEKPVISLKDNILMAAGTSVMAEEEEETLIDTTWTRERILQVLMQSGGTGGRDSIANDTGKVIIKDIIEAIKAANKLMDKYFNPDKLDITYINLEGDLLTLRYALGVKEITVHVDMNTYNPFFAKYDTLCANTALKVRSDISRRMGVDSGEIHINKVLPFLYIYDSEAVGAEEIKDISIYPYPFPSTYGFSARVGKYTLEMEYKEYSYPWYFDYKKGGMDEIVMPSIWPSYPISTITLKSFVDNTTGRDYVKEAEVAILGLFNPEKHNIGVAYWGMYDGTLQLSVDLYNNGYPYIRFIGSIIAVKIDLATGQISIDKDIVAAVKKAREETSYKLHIDIGDVHINSIYRIYRYILTAEGSEPILQEPPYIINASTPQFNLTFEYYTHNGKLTLTSFVNRETGQNLLKDAVYYLMKVVNPNEFEVYGWNKYGDYVIFYFKLRDGSIVTVNVNVNTGEPSIYEKLANAVLKTREDIAKKMGLYNTDGTLNIEGVHIDGIKYFLYICVEEALPDDYGIKTGIVYPYPYPRVTRYGFTANVDNYTLTLEYREYYNYYYSYKYPVSEDGIIIRPIWPPYQWTTIALTGFVDNRTGRDYVKEAKEAVLKLLNPEDTNLGVDFWSMQDGVLRLNIDMHYSYYSYIKRLGTTIMVEVNLGTGTIKIDEGIVEAVKKVREETAQNLEIDMSDVHVNSIIGLSWRAMGDTNTYYPGGTVYMIEVTTLQFKLSYNYRIDYDYSGNVKKRLELTAFVNRETGQDLLKNAEDYLKKIFNPDEFELAYWGAGDEVIGFAFKLKDGSIVKVEVNISTGEPNIYSKLVDAVIRTREDIAKKTGMDFGDVHINGIEYYYYIYADEIVKEGEDTAIGVIYPYPYPRETRYGFTANVEHYTLTLEYREYSYPYPWYFEYKYTTTLEGEVKTIWPVYNWSIVELEGFVDNRTGRDYVKEAEKMLLDLLNPENSNIGVNYWSMQDGILNLSIDLFRAKYPFLQYLGGIVQVTVDLETGQIGIDKRIVDAVRKAREETSNNLSIPLEDVHINGIMLTFDLVKIDSTYGTDVYTLIVSTPQFSLTYNYGPHGELSLTSLVFKETNQDLLKNAEEYLKKILNPDGYTLGEWSVDWIDGEKTITFAFNLPDGSRVKINVNMETGEPRMPDDLKEAVIKTREDIARNMGFVDENGNVDTKNVHINGISFLLYAQEGSDEIDAEYGNYPRSGYRVTARVDNYTLTLDCETYNYPWLYGESQTGDDGTIIWPPDEKKWWIVTLTSFVDNRTGRDYVKESLGKVCELFNPENQNLGVGYWNMEDGLLKLNINLSYGTDSYKMHFRGNVPVEVNVETGEINIDQRLVDAVTKSRREASEKLDVDYSDTHVNGIFLEYPLYILTIYPPEPVEPTAYVVAVSTSEFELTLRYDFANGNLELTRLANRETGVDLVNSTKNDMVERFGVEYNKIHITRFSLDRPEEDPSCINNNSSVMVFTMKVDGQDNRTYIYNVNADTGEIISILIGIRLFDTELFVDITDGEISADEVIAKIKENETIHIDEELLQRMAIEEAIAAQVGDDLFDPHMADEDDVQNQE